MSHFVQNGTSRTPSPTVDCKMEMKSVLRNDAVPDRCFFGHGYKEGSVWNRPLQYFPQQRNVANAVPDGYLFGHGYKEGSVWNRPLQYFLNNGTSRTPSPTDAFSGMVTKKGRFGTDPYNIFLNNGMSLTPFHTKFPRPTGEG